MQSHSIVKDATITRIQDSNKWDWIPANHTLETTIANSKQYVETTPSIVLTHPEGDQFPEPYVTLVIDTEKQLKFSDELGWNWHKSWNLPNIVVRLEIKDAQTQELLLSPKNLYAQLFAVKKIQDHSRTYLIDVGLRGTSKIELIDGQAYFSALRFASTSYNNEGVKFHLLMCVYIQNDNNEKPQILNSTISPPIFVDSRKSAGNSEQKKLFLYAEPFTFDLLEKKYFKRENKKKTEQDVQIENDFESLFNYLTAPNIRHKVKHPLFLMLKFSQCVSIYYNTVSLEEDPRVLLEKLQNCLSKDIMTKIHGQQTEKLFYILIDESSDQNKNKKVLEAIEFLNTPNLEIIKKTEQVPEKFKILGDNTQLLEVYKENFDNLSKIFKAQAAKFESEQMDSYSNESDEQSESEPQSIKKVKIDNVQEPLQSSQQELKQIPEIQKESQPIQQSVQKESVKQREQKKVMKEVVIPQKPQAVKQNSQSISQQLNPQQLLQQQSQIPQQSMMNQSLLDQQQQQFQQFMAMQQQQQQQQQQQPTQQQQSNPYMSMQNQDFLQQMMFQANPLLNPLFMMQQQLLQQQNPSQQQLAQQLLQNQYLQYMQQLNNSQYSQQPQQSQGQRNQMQNLMGLSSLGMNPQLLNQLQQGFQQQYPQFGQQQAGQMGQLGQMGHLGGGQMNSSRYPQDQQLLNQLGFMGFMNQNQQNPPQGNRKGGNRDIKEEGQ